MWTPDVTKVPLPRGRILLGRKSPAGVQGAKLFVGNAPKLDMTGMGVETEDLTDWTSNVPLPFARIIKKVMPEFSLTLKEANPHNLSIIFGAAEPTELTQPNAAVTGEALPPVKLNGIYRTAKRKPGTLTLASDATPFVITTNYVVRDADLGVFEIVALPVGVDEGDPLTVGYTPTAIVAGSGPKRILAATAPLLEGSLLYVGNSNVGPKHLVEIYNCSFVPDGNYPWISENTSEFSVKVTALSDGVHSEPFLIEEI